MTVITRRDNEQPQQPTMKLLSLSPPPSLSRPTPPLFFTSLPRISEPISRKPAGTYVYRQNFIFSLRKSGTRMFTQVEERSTREPTTGEWGKVSAVLFDMDGVLCDSEEPSRLAAVELFAEMGVEVTAEDFVPFMGTGEANFLGGVAAVKGVKGFDPEAAKKRFFEIYLDKYAKPNSGIGFPGALELISQCKSKGLKVAVASSADRIKVNANLAAAGLPLSIFDAIISADKFENLKPAPDIFLSASKILNVPTYECIVIEDALAGVQAAKSAGMRCIALTTTLSEEALKAAGPSFIRKEIQNVSIDDILSGGSINEKAIEPQYLEAFAQSSLQEPTEQVDNVSEQDNHANNGNVSSVFCITSAYPRLTRVGGLTYVYATLSLQLLAKKSFPRLERIIRFSRRDLLRYGSLGVAISCLAFAIANWKAMQYTSPKAFWNSLFGGSNPSFDKNDDGSQNLRIQQFVRYISDIESKGTAPFVPEFPSKLDWLNTAPLMFSRDLKGKVVLLDFWTYCCINCMHVLPDLEFLEKKYKDMPFTVVGVHSAKFDNEKDSDAIRNAVLRYGITHPVVNDGDMYLWRELGVSSWPTFAIISPNGKLLAQLAGEGHRKDIDDMVEAAFLYYGEKKELDNSSLPLRLEKDNDPRLSTSPLKFPGKLAIDILNNRLFISDSNHNRIVVTDLDGTFVMQIGSTGQEGLRDGSFDEATFNRPQGLAYSSKKNLLYIADTENHAFRVIDFVNETVRTVAGNGTKGLDYEGGGTGMNQLLNSPWDVCFEPVSEKVYIAMAGQHQIWEHDISNGVTKAFSGNGYERNLNGSGPTNTSFAQPSGISLSGDYKEAYIADSESSSIRALDLITGGSRLLAGGDPLFSENLFRFGDHDGKGSNALLQHPLGVYYAKNGQVYIADSYNHKIKKLDLGSNEVTTIAGTGKAGFLDGSPFKAQLSEPSGIVEGENGRLYIADTNNSLIRYLDLNKEGAKLLTLELNGVKPPVARSKTPKRLRSRTSADTLSIKVDGISTNQGKLTLAISVPEGYHFSKEARSKFFVESEPDGAVVFSPAEGSLDEQGSSIILFKRSSNSSSTGRILCKVYYCKEDEVCLYQSLVFKVPFLEKTGSAAAERTLSYVVKPRSSPSGLQLTESLQ